MGREDHGLWEPATVGELAALFSGAPFRWWISGGTALELYAGRTWRGHDDIDVGICRGEAPAVYGWLRGLDLWVAAGGRLRRWDGAPLSAAADQNNVWARPKAGGPWRFDIAVGDGSADTWIYRRDTEVSRPWSEALMTTSERVPYLAPEVQLLFKAKLPRPKDHVDAEVVIPMLEEPRRAWLRDHLPAGHQWLSRLG